MTHFYRLGCASGATRISRTWYRVLSEDQLGSVHEAAEFHCFGHRRSLSCALGVRAQQADRMRRVGVLLAAYIEADRAGQVRVNTLKSTLQKLG